MEESTSAKDVNDEGGFGPTEIVAMIKMLVENKDVARQYVELFKPLIGEVSDLLMDTLGPEVEKVVTRTALGKADIRKVIFDKYVSNGFTKEDAITFMLADIGQASAAGRAANKVLESVSK